MHLLLSIFIVIPIAIIYGFFPSLLLDIFPKTIDEHNFHKAIMGLYLAFGTIWITGIFNQEFWKTATVSNVCFMFGLGFGRTISIFIDGYPTSIFIYGTIGELVLGIYALFQLKSINK